MSYPQRFAALCAACHGANGRIETPLMPVLAGQPSLYVITQLFLFREGRRSNEVMTAVARTLTDDDLRGLFRFHRDPATRPSPATGHTTRPDPHDQRAGAGGAAQMLVLSRCRPGRRRAGAPHRRPARGLPSGELARFPLGLPPRLHAVPWGRR